MLATTDTKRIAAPLSNKSSQPSTKTELEIRALSMLLIDRLILLVGDRNVSTEFVESALELTESLRSISKIKPSKS